MRSRTPKAEKEFIAQAIAPVRRRLRKAEALEEFLAYARSHGADPLLFPGRLHKVLKGESPAPFLVALLLSWHQSRSR